MGLKDNNLRPLFSLLSKVFFVQQISCCVSEYLTRKNTSVLSRPGQRHQGGAPTCTPSETKANGNLSMLQSICSAGEVVVSIKENDIKNEIDSYLHAQGIDV